MPGPIDLTGQRFGKLVALRAIPATGKHGRDWECRCDCGAKTIVPLNRLNRPDDDPRVIRCCEVCRSKPCAICGEPFLRAGSGKTCGSELCRLEYRRLMNRGIYYRKMQSDPHYLIKKKAIWLNNLRARDPVFYDEYMSARRAIDAQRQRIARLREAGGDRAVKRARDRAYYAKNRDRVRDYMRKWVDSLPPDRRAVWDASMKDSTRRYRQRRALAQLMQDAAKLLQQQDQHND